jgi:glycosyltransferase involved in cell wall biosynthesis
VKILYVSQYFPPEMGAPAARAAELSKHWRRMGHEVTVLTGFPNHPTGVVPREWRARLRRLHYTETVDGVRVVRTWLWPLPNRKAHERIRNYTSFCISAAISGLPLQKPDVLIATSPQLLCALAGWFLAWRKRVPFIFEVRDLWPESLAAVGAGGAGTFLHRALGAIAGFLYRHADLIVVVSPAFREHLALHWKVTPEKIAVVENGVETHIFQFDEKAFELRKELFLQDRTEDHFASRTEDRFLICYIGTMGNAHGLETLIAAADELRTAFPAAMFLVIGEGAEKARIVELAARRGLGNIRFLGQQPHDRIPAYISASDLCLVMLKKTELFKTVIPTKMLEYMACEKPVIVAVDGQARKIIDEADAGVFVEPENCRELVQAILRLSTEMEGRKEMGKNGRQYVLKNFSREKKAKDYICVLETLLRGEGEANSSAGQDKI